MTDTTTVGTEHLRILFDALASSLDFGSGFLVTEEVEALRSVAVLIGVDPAEATPREFRSQYPHPYTVWKDHNGVAWPENGCAISGMGRCKAGPEDPIHQEQQP